MLERLKNLVMGDLNLKLVALAVSLLLYSLMHGGQDARRAIVVDLDVRLPTKDSDRVLVSSPPRSVRMFVRGSNQTIDNLRAASVSVLVDASKGQHGHVTLDKSMVRLPDGVIVEVEQFDPPGLDFQWETRISRDVPVQVSVVGAPAAGFVVKGAPVSEPKTVKVKGPQSAVAVLQHVRSDAFDVKGLTDGSYPRQLAVERPPRVELVEPASVIVTAEIARELAERVFPKLSVVVVGTPKGKTQPAEVDVQLVCPPEVVRALRPEQVVPIVEVTSKDPSGSQTLPVLVRLDRCEAYARPKEVVVRW